MELVDGVAVKAPSSRQGLCFVEGNGDCLCRLRIWVIYCLKAENRLCPVDSQSERTAAANTANTASGAGDGVSVDCRILNGAGDIEREAKAVGRQRSHGENGNIASRITLFNSVERVGNVDVSAYGVVVNNSQNVSVFASTALNRSPSAREGVTVVVGALGERKEDIIFVCRRINIVVDDVDSNLMLRHAGGNS